MSTYQLPIDSAHPHCALELDLEGTIYRLVLDWNDRDASWYLSLELVDGTQMLDGRKVVLSWPMLRRLTHARRPPGELVFVDTSGTNVEPGRDDLGGRVLAVYLEAADVVTARAAAGGA